MPLMPGSSRETISRNIDELTHHGSRPRSHNQIVAIALSNADKHPHAANGGMVSAAPGMQHMAMGGLLSALNPPWAERQEARGVEHEAYHPGGLIGGGSAGRTDRVPLAVAADSFVVPAAEVSTLGQGNTLAGAKILDAVFKSGPYGSSLPHRRARGGAAPPGSQSHILAASGEYIVDASDVKRIGGGDISKGQSILRKMVDNIRKAEMKRLKTAPKPKA